MFPSLQVAVELTEPSPTEENNGPEKPVCANCRSTLITFDATACWDANNQQFEYDIFDDKALCLNCDGKQRVEWVPL